MMSVKIVHFLYYTQFVVLDWDYSQHFPHSNDTISAPFISTKPLHSFTIMILCKQRVGYSVMRWSTYIILVYLESFCYLW